MIIQYKRPYLYPEQESAIFSDSRISLIEASTKSGKTIGCVLWILEQCMSSNRECWWVSPTRKQSKIAFDRSLALLRSLDKSLWSSNKSDLSISLHSAGKVSFLTGEKPDHLYGEDVQAAVVDEASRVREESWHALRSTLTATGGPVRIIGNVKGTLNWFYKLCRAVENEPEKYPGITYHHITWREAVAAGVLSTQDIEEARRDYPPHVFKELFEAKAASIEGALWSWDVIDRNRVYSHPELVRVDLGVDPSGGAGVCGIVAAGADKEGIVYVLGDFSEKSKSSMWGRKIDYVSRQLNLDYIAAEKNYGGDMVETVLDLSNVSTPIIMVNATRDKSARASPVSMLYWQNKVKHVGQFPDLEEQMVSWNPDESGFRTDRVDALVWAVRSLLPRRRVPTSDREEPWLVSAETPQSQYEYQEA